MEVSPWHSRGYLPHFDAPGLLQGVTFRLADALPAHVLAAMAADYDATADAASRARLEAHLNAGYGACHLRDPRMGRLVEEALLHFDGERYRLIAWVVMPNHVHVLVETKVGHALKTVVHSWKSFTALQANRLLGRVGAFWYPEYYDRFIRDERHLGAAIAYIHHNPVSAGLVAAPEAWPFGSARRWLAEDG